MKNKTAFNQGWTFDDGDSQTDVTLPHSAVEIPYDYCDETSYHKAFRYSKKLEVPEEWLGREVALRFDAVMADAKVLLNGTETCAYSDGYTPFEARLTDGLHKGENLIEVTLSGAENPDIPPFGGTLDFLTYAGIYRDVWLIVSDPVRIASVKIETPGLAEGKAAIKARVRLDNPQDRKIAGNLTARLLSPDGSEIKNETVSLDGIETEFTLSDLGPITLWDIDNPALYKLELHLELDGSEDLHTVSFGFRYQEFREDGFYLNGRPLKLVGLNRHQSFPYVGYALGRAAQEKDVEILKQDLGLNLVRTSHYPQSPWFLDHCDRLGLLVVEEIPGWQHIGDEAWQEKSIANVEAMIERDWNHPSIILWGVRVNESPDNHAFYSRTNALARELDPTRQTGGIRCITDSEFLEDVYTMNDFILGEEIMPGNNRGKVPLRDQKEVTGLNHHVPYLVTEYAGHMYPTNIEDGEERQFEHVLKHVEVLNAMYGDPHVAGSIGWCFADYNTHKDFGAGDRICHHGVLNMYRQPKFAAYVYQSQLAPDKRIVMEPVSYWTMGNRSTGGVLPLMVLTNCDRVELVTRDKHMVGHPARDRFPHLAHPPVFFEGNQQASNGFDLWGAAFTDVEFVGYIEGKEVARRKMSSAPLPDHLEALADRDHLQADGSDCTRISLRALDQAGNRLPFLQDIVRVSIDGTTELVGPDEIQFRGGYAAFWLRSGGKVGSSTITISSGRFAPTSIVITEDQVK